MTSIWDNDATISLAIEFEARGFRLRCTEQGKLAVGPMAKLTEADMAAIRQHRDALLALAIIHDDAVLDSAEAFRRNPTHLRCQDCDRPGPRCWRCCLAHRLAYPHPGDNLTTEEIFRLAAPILRREAAA